MTRIISGRLRGKIIKAPAKLPIRPTTDFAKESLFNILANRFYFEEISVLDLFAGSGNLSYEFASRGCTPITAVDLDRHCTQFIEKTSAELKLDIRVIRSEILDFLKRDYHEYDVIVADPPYDYDGYEDLVERVFFQNLLKRDGVLIIEHHSRDDLSGIDRFVQFRKYGKVGFSFFEASEIA
jgi:16S rRNA (guanine(966)-N(2))-methyltransferase RsmD